MKNTCVVIENDVNISKLCVENEEETSNERIDHSTKKEGHNNGGNNIKVINNKTSNLIVNESNVNTKHMGNLGKWISTSRIRSGVTNETRSQSLPDCYAKKICSDENECSDVLKLNSSIKLEHISNQDACFWFNTWPEKISKSLDAEQKNDKNVASRGYCDVMIQQNNSEKKCAHVNSCKCLSLNEALENFQLAYDPVTKQLQYSQKKNVIHNVKSKIVVNDASISDNNSERVKQQQCDVEETVPCSVTNIKGDVKTSGHRRTLDAGSFSSTVSSLSDASPSGSLLGSEERSLSSGDELGGIKTKKKGISAFFTRGVFSSTGSWRLFGGRIGVTETETSSAEDIVASSSALIQHIRPSTLPAKDFEEERRHRDEYREMIEAAKRKDVENTKAKRKKQERQLRLEEQQVAAAKQWTTQILPSWESLRNHKKTRELWWQGLPPSIRGRVWKLAIGNDLNISRELYDICVTRAQERLHNCSSHSSSLNLSGMRKSDSDCCLKNRDIIDLKLSRKYSDSCCQDIHKLCLCEDSLKAEIPLHKQVFGLKNGCGLHRRSKSVDQESSMEVIRLDISRTFPSLGIFQEGGPYFDILHELLAAYVCYRPDVGYVQGMSFIAAILILNMEPVEAFTCFANLLNRPLLLAAFTVNTKCMTAYYKAYDTLFKENLPKLYEHFSKATLTPDLYVLDWVYTVYAKAMPLDVACRVWDLFLRDGDEFIFRTALGILHLHQETLQKLDFLDGAQFLTRLPDDLSSEQLFRSIQSITVGSTKRSFSQLVEKCRGNIST